MLSGPRMQRQRCKKPSQPIGGNQKSGYGWGRYGNRREVGMARITNDKRTRFLSDSPELSPFSALVKENEQRNNQQSPCSDLKHPLQARSPLVPLNFHTNSPDTSHSLPVHKPSLTPLVEAPYYTSRNVRENELCQMLSTVELSPDSTTKVESTQPKSNQISPSPSDCVSDPTTSTNQTTSPPSSHASHTTTPHATPPSHTTTPHATPPSHTTTFLTDHTTSPSESMSHTISPPLVAYTSSSASRSALCITPVTSKVDLTKEDLAPSKIIDLTEEDPLPRAGSAPLDLSEEDPLPKTESAPLDLTEEEDPLPKTESAPLDLTEEEDPLPRANLSRICTTTPNQKIVESTPTCLSQYTPINQLITASPLLQYLSPVQSVCLTDGEKVLALCEQDGPISLLELFTESMESSLYKLGDGVFAEVFSCITKDSTKLAYKIIPVGGELEHNGERQATYAEILPEMVISQELCLLGRDRALDYTVANNNYTRNFLQISRMSLCRGQYPQSLLDVWDEHDRVHNSENDRPDFFLSDQHYVVFAGEYAGTQVDDFVFHSFDEARSVLIQVAATLAVGEAALEFEHRDLHTGNVLVRKTDAERVLFEIDGTEYSVETHGVSATIVDYTLSRIRQGSCVSYNDLNKIDWLFSGRGDLQFDVYRTMKEAANSDWECYNPGSNVMWLNYLMVKLSQRNKLEGFSSRGWRASFRPFVGKVLKHTSACDAFLNLFWSTQ